MVRTAIAPRRPLGRLSAARIRPFTANAVLSGLLMACAPSATPDPAGTVRGRIQLLATADVGGETDACACHPIRLGGLAPRTSIIADRRRGFAGSTLVVDAGDVFFRRTSVPTRYETAALKTAEILADAMAGWGTAAMAVGERDLAFGVDQLRRLGQRAQVRLLSANLIRRDDGQPVFDAYAVVDAGGLKIGLVGVSPILGDKDALGAVYRRQGVTSGPLQPAVLRAAKAAKEAGADWVVGLLHVGRDAARALLAALPPSTIDFAVVGGDRTTDRLHLVGGTASGYVMGGERGQAVVAVETTIVAGAQRIEEVGPTDAPARSTAHRVRVDTIDVLPAAPKASPRTKVRPQGRRAGPRKRAYAGSRQCRTCHEDAYRHWRSTGHARAWKTLKRLRQTRNLDCVMCHSTGFGHPGGPRLLKQLKRFRAVGCESCHGPGRAHAEDPQRKLRFGAVVPERVCIECHRVQGDQHPFVYAERLQRVVGKGHRASTDGRDRPVDDQRPLSTHPSSDG